MECCEAHELSASSLSDVLIVDNHRQEGAAVCLLHTARLEQVQGKARTSSPTSRNDAVGIPTLGGMHRRRRGEECNGQASPGVNLRQLPCQRHVQEYLKNVNYTLTIKQLVLRYMNYSRSHLMQRPAESKAHNSLILHCSS